MKLSAPKRILNEETPKNNSGVLLYNGRSYAVGLLWFTVQEDTAKELLKQRINKAKADFYCLRTHVSQQQGFGWLNKGHRRGMQAAAAMIADQLVGEWHGVFEAENGWWYVQVRSDTITPNGDRFFKSEEEAYQTFQDESTKNIWPHSYAPERWRLNDPNCREIKLATILDGLSSTALLPSNLTASFGSAMIRNLVFGGLSFVLVLMIYVAFDSLTTEPVQIPQSPVPVRTINKKPDVVTVNQSVSPQQLLQQCSDAADELYTSLPGWKPKAFTCQVGKANLSWQQFTGSLTDAKTVGLKTWSPKASITLNNRVLTVTEALGSLPKLERSQLVTQEIALLYLEENMQPLGALQVKPVIPSVSTTPPNNNATTAGAANTPPPVPPQSYLDITFSTGFGPEKIAPLLTAPALELAQLQWDVLAAKWQYKLKWTIQSIKQVPKTASPATGKSTPNAASNNTNNSPASGGK